jgi:hypothetical protein
MLNDAAIGITEQHRQRIDRQRTIRATTNGQTD